MESIAQAISIRQTLNGVLVCQSCNGPNSLKGGNRATREKGDITEFSAASRLRFRRLLASSWSVNADDIPYGLCLTIPPPVISQDEARKIWADWSRDFARDFADIPCIWRVELQKRKQAHWHCVLWLPRDKATLGEKIFEIELKWKREIRKRVANISKKSDRGFERYGVRWMALSDTISASRYLAPTLDHETKRKQDQLGWVGRQWGIINRKRLRSDCVGEPVVIAGEAAKRVVARFRAVQEDLRAKGTEYVGAGVYHGRLPAVNFGADARRLMEIFEDEQQS